MRKFFSFFAAVLFAGSMMAEVTITPENSSWTSTAGAQTGTVEGVTIAVTNGLASSGQNPDQIRIYKDATLTISSEASISKIEFTCTANGTTKYGPGCFAAQDGYSYEGKVGTWIGSATSVSFTASSNQVRATQIVVTLGDAPAVAAPVISGDANFFDSTIVSISGATGNTIYYTLDGTDPNAQSAVYANPFKLTATTTVKAVAFNGELWSDAVAKTFTKAPSFASFEALIAAELPDKTIVEVSFENVKIDSFYVSSQSKKQGLYFTVNEKAYEIYYNKAEVPETWEVGGTVSGTIRGNWTVYKGIWEIVPSANDWAWALTYKAAAPIVGGWEEILFTAATAVGAFNDSVFAVGDFKLTCVDTDNNKLKTTANTAYFGSSDLDSIRYDFRLQTSGKSSAKNALNLTIPADGMLRIAVRTGSNADLTRTLVLVQGQDTLYNQVVVETDTIEGYTAPKIYKYVKVAVKAGTVAVSYPVNALNFYAFGFKADEAPAAPVYTVVGGSAPLFGKTWDPAYEANNMEPIVGSEYRYAWKKEGVALTAGTIEYKVCQDHGWTTAWPAQGNYNFTIDEAGLYDVTIFFNPDLETPTQVIAEFKGSVVVLPNIILHGNFTGSWADTEAFTPAADSLTASLELALTEGTYEFGFKFDGAWKANGANITREANTANLSTGEGNMHIAADVPGNYIFTYTYATQDVVVTYPNPIIVPDTVAIVVTEDLEWTDAVASQGWWQIMGENEGYSFSLSNSYTTEVPGIYTVADLDETYSYVKPINGTDEIHFVSGQVVVAINTDSIITFVGALTGTDNKVYAFYLAYDPAAVNPYKYDEKDADFVYDFDSYELNTKYVAQGVMTISAQTDSTSLGLIVYLPQGQTTLVAGEYPVAATPAYQTVVAGYYDAEYAFSGSMAATLIKQGDKLYYNKIWYLVSGKATVDADLNITVDALNSNSKLIKANLKAQPQGIEDVKAAQKATKSLKNGILVIEKNGVQYNVTGQEIR